MRACVQQEAAIQNTRVDLTGLSNPTAGQRAYVMSTGFHQKDPEAAAYYGNMMESCAMSQKCYNKALEMADADDYALHADIFDAGAGLYDTIGMRDEAKQTRDAAAVARARVAGNDLFLPLSPLAVIAALGCALILAGRTAR